MKVKLATQLFSRSVYNTLRFLDTVLHKPNFEDTKATCEFILIMNDIFDIFNSSKFSSQVLKCPMTQNNMKFWLATFEKTEGYIRGLTDISGTPITKTGRKTPFLGILGNIQSFKNIFQLLVVHGPFSQLRTYYCSQDHLEIFFSYVRIKFGANNNPTCSQFRNLYRRLISGISSNISINANVLLQDQCEFLAVIPTYEERLQFVYDKYDLSNDYIETIQKMSTSEYQKNCLEYIGGFVAKKVANQVTCAQCETNLLKQEKKINSLVSTKDNGGLLHVSSQVYNILKVCENVLKEELKEGWTTKKYISDLIRVKTQNIVLDRYPEVINFFHEHSVEVVSKIATTFISIRLKHFAKQENERIKQNRLRKKLSKLVHFNNQ